jgi:hypothetical protein
MPREDIDGPGHPRRAIADFNPDLPTVSSKQLDHGRRYQSVISVEQAIKVPGARHRNCTISLEWRSPATRMSTRTDTESP